MGITFIEKNGVLTVKRIADGGPAALAGSVRVGDVIKTVSRPPDAHPPDLLRPFIRC